MSMEGVTPTEDATAPHHHDGNKMPLKPILKKPSAKKLDIGSVVINPQGTASHSHPTEPEDSPSTAIKWDEPTIAEHDKERGTRTKITEPKTPYHHDGSSDDEAGLLHASTSMDLDSSGTDGEHSDSSHHKAKLSPRFILEHKRRHHHHHHGHASDTHSSSGGSTSHEHTDPREEDEGPSGRKVRQKAEPLSPQLDVGVLQKRMAQVEQERAIDDNKMQADSKADSGSGSSTGSSDDDDEEFLTPQERAKKQAFENRRKQHYDEFRRMKELMSKQNDSDDADSSDSESDD